MESVLFINIILGIRLSYLESKTVTLKRYLIIYMVCLYIKSHNGLPKAAYFTGCDRSLSHFTVHDAHFAKPNICFVFSLGKLWLIKGIQTRLAQELQFKTCCFGFHSMAHPLGNVWCYSWFDIFVLIMSGYRLAWQKPHAASLCWTSSARCVNSYFQNTTK